MEGIIVTVRTRPGSVEFDMELSPNTACGELAGQIVEAIRMKDTSIARMVGANPYLSTIDGRRLDDETNLGRMGIWDGSILVLGG